MSNNRRGFVFFESYSVAIFGFLKDKREQDAFAGAIVRYVFLDEQPKFSEGSVLDTLWKMVLPNLDASKRQSKRNQGAPKGNKNNRAGRNQYSEDNPEDKPQDNPEDNRGAGSEEEEKSNINRRLKEDELV